MTQENFTIHRIRELLAIKSWSLYRLSKESQIPYSTLNNMLQRNTDPTIPSLEKICDGFGITLCEFFQTETPTPTETSPMERELIDNWRMLSSQDKRLLQIYLYGLLKKKL